MNEIGMQAREHLAEEQVSAWLAGEVSGGERERIAAHLADCDRCREELVAVRRLLHGETAERSPRASSSQAAIGNPRLSSQPPRTIATALRCASGGMMACIS